MRRSEALQGVRMIKFQSVLERYDANAVASSAGPGQPGRANQPGDTRAAMALILAGAHRRSPVSWHDGPDLPQQCGVGLCPRRRTALAPRVW